MRAEHDAVMARTSDLGDKSYALLYNLRLVMTPIQLKGVRAAYALPRGRAQTELVCRCRLRASSPNSTGWVGARECPATFSVERARRRAMLAMAWCWARCDLGQHRRCWVDCG